MKVKEYYDEISIVNIFEQTRIEAEKLREKVFEPINKTIDEANDNLEEQMYSFIEQMVNIEQTV